MTDDTGERDDRVPDTEDEAESDVALQDADGPWTPIDQTPPSRGEDHADYGANALASLAKLRMFMAYFIWVADRRFPASQKPEARVANHKDECPRLYWACVLLDMLLLIGVVVLAARAAYKSVWI